MSVPSMKDIDFWDEFIKPLKEAIRSKPRTQHELRVVVLSYVQRKQAGTLLLNALAYMSYHKIARFDSKSQTWRLPMNVRTNGYSAVSIKRNVETRLQ